MARQRDRGPVGPSFLRKEEGKGGASRKKRERGKFAFGKGVPEEGGGKRRARVLEKEKKRGGEGGAVAP